TDVYISIIESLKHAAAALEKPLIIDWLNALDYEEDEERIKTLSAYHGLLVPGGFGERGVEGKIKVIQFARTTGVPFFGLCYGMQLAVIEYARHILNWPDAHTTEINPETKYPVIDLMPEQKKNLKNNNYGATMRLGAYPAKLLNGTIARAAYGGSRVSERHRHRYEINPAYLDKFKENGMIFSGCSPDGRLMEIIELAPAAHPFFLGTQFHPEFKSRPLAPHPLFLAFLRAAVDRAKSCRIV
ncbi:MAG: CTP synthase, partial [Patescibacteria group bacterium]